MATDEKIRELIKNRMQDVSSSCRVTSCQVWLRVKDLMNTEVAVIAPDQTMAMAATVMADDGYSSLVVVDNGENIGIITEKDFLEKVAAKGKAAIDIKVSDIMSSPVISVSSDMTVLEAGKIAEDRHVKRLPVVEAGKLVGIVTQTDLIRVLTSYGMWRDVTEIMTTEVATIQKQATVAEAATIMTQRGISGIVVLQDKKIVGVLTERDLLKRVIAPGRDPALITVGQMMSSPAVTIPPHFSVFSASRVMEKMHIRRVVVEDNKWLCGVVTQTDIFRAVEDKWLEEEQKNIKNLEESDTCVYTLDLDGKITYVNPAFLRLLEISDSSELIGRAFLPEELWFDKREIDSFANELKKETVVVKDLTLKTTSGKRIDVTVYSSPTKNIHCKIDGRQGIVNDITAKKEVVALKEAQKALAESEDRYRRITEAVTDYVYTVHFKPNMPAQPVHGPASAAITGYSPKEFKACPTLWLDIVYPDDLEIVREQVSRCICGQGFGPIDHRITRKDGQIRWIRRTLVPSFNSEGKLRSYDGMLQDITDLKVAEQIQMQLLGELEQATEELKDFAYIVSQNVKGTKKLETPAGQVPQNDGKEHITKVLLTRIQKMHNLVEGMLYCSQGPGREKKVEVDLNEIVRYITNEIAAGDNIRIAVESRLPVILASPRAIRHIFYNLIASAAACIGNAEGKIVVDWQQDDESWKFTISDNGPRMDEESFRRILKSNQGLQPQDNFESTGMGLSIVRKIVEFQNGILCGRSNPDDGNTFYFTLPKGQEQFGAMKAVLAGLVN